MYNLWLLNQSLLLTHMPIKSPYIGRPFNQIIHSFIHHLSCDSLYGEQTRYGRCSHTAHCLIGERENNSNCVKCQKRKSTRRHKGRGKKHLLWIIREDFSENWIIESAFFSFTAWTCFTLKPRHKRNCPVTTLAHYVITAAGHAVRVTGRGRGNVMKSWH